jgi:hypothetical protein
MKPIHLSILYCVFLLVASFFNAIVAAHQGHCWWALFNAPAVGVFAFIAIWLWCKARGPDTEDKS